MKKLVQCAIIVAALITMAGCASTTVKKEAFAKPPKLAIITISGSAHGVFTSDSEDAKILADTVPTCVDEIAKSHRIRLMPAKAALSSKAYAAMKDNGARFTMQLVPGYKEISLDDEKQHLHALAKELHADGFVLLYLNYGQQEGFGVGIGPIGIGSKKPTADVGIAAVDPDGQSIWQGHGHTVGDDGIITVDNIGSYSKLIAKFKALTQTACGNTVQDLEKQFTAQ